MLRIQCGYEFRVDQTCSGIYNTTCVSDKKVNISFKNVWRTWEPALPTLLADLMIFCPLGLTNFKNSDRSAKSCFPNQMCSLITNRKSIVLALLLFYRHRILFHFM